MDNQTKWIFTRMRLGWIFLAAGILIFGVGVFIQLQYAGLPYNLRIISGLGILLTGIGIAYIVRYRSALKDPQSAHRLKVEERDERTLLIRGRAGNRAFWTSTALVYTGLMWASLAANGDLPDLSGDVLWYFLVATVLIPFIVYIISFMIDQRNI